MKFNKSILITLGHNSSVIFFQPGSKPIGYEEERLSGIKSDSSYPKLALEKVISKLGHNQLDGCNVFISHWFDHFDLKLFPNKYFDYYHFHALVLQHQLQVIPVTGQFTHHDAHAYSTLAFSENFQTKVEGKKHFIVVDGFGNNQEVISIYEQVDDVRTTLMPLNRVYGYKNSLGLLYQYATAFCGMKENQDEYKFLGYESSIKDVLTNEQIEYINVAAYTFSMSFLTNCLIVRTMKPDASSGIISFDTLKKVRQEMYYIFGGILKATTGETTHSERDTRVIIGYFVQACLEQSLLRILKKYNMKNVYLSGGCFLNVKLNKMILDNIDGHVCVNPLSGDQGAAIGMFRKYTNSQFDFNDLCFGVRDETPLAIATKMSFLGEGIYIKADDASFVETVSYFVGQNFIVNVIQNDMEFGPRALCNTTTLALPTAENTMYINMVNERNEVMPMAPVMLKASSSELLYASDLDRVIGSNKYMIITHDFRSDDLSKHRGILHTKPINAGYTCRPQIIDDNSSNIGKILSDLKPLGVDCLINTSFNTHGRPILYSFASAVEDFRKQKLRDIEKRLILVVLEK